ncbi:MAG: hypothetical protein Q6K90_02375, partial [Gloeomargarita sp. HHBFW_bins_162]
MARLFASETCYGLADIFSQERQRIITLLAQNTLTQLDQLYSQVYRENYGVIMAFRRDHLPVPQELQVAAAITLSQKVMFLLRRLELETSNPLHDGPPNGTVYLHELHSLTQEVQQVGVHLDIQEGRQIVERLLLTWLDELLTRLPDHLLEIGVQRWQKLFLLSESLHLHPQMERIQERYFAACYQGRLGAELLELAPLVRVAPPSCSMEPWLKPRTAVVPPLLPTIDAPAVTVATLPPAEDGAPDTP